MDENLKDSTCENAGTKTEADKAANTRNRKMRSWLGVKSSFSSNGHPDDFGPVSYGDGHSGWNR